MCGCSEGRCTPEETKLGAELDGAMRCGLKMGGMTSKGPGRSEGDGVRCGLQVGAPVEDDLSSSSCPLGPPLPPPVGSPPGGGLVVGPLTGGLVPSSPASAAEVGPVVGSLVVSCGVTVGTKTNSNVGVSVPPYGDAIGHRGTVVAVGLSVAIEGDDGPGVGDCGLTTPLGHTTACTTRM